MTAEDGEVQFFVGAQGRRVWMGIGLVMHFGDVVRFVIRGLVVVLAFFAGCHGGCSGKEEEESR